MGLKTSYKWGEITSISRGDFTPVPHLFSVSDRVYFTPFITSDSGPTESFKLVKQEPYC